MIAPAFAGVILAAGYSTRMGRDKALLPWHHTNFLGAAIDMLFASTDLVIIVGGANSESLKPEIYRRGAFLTINPDPSRGQFSSLQTGLQEVLNRGRDAAVVTLVDRPPTVAATVAALTECFRTESRAGKWAVVPEVIDAATGIAKHGHPIILSREMIEFIFKAPVTSNARDVMHAHQDRIRYVTVEDGNTIRNVNTPEEYAALIG